MPSEAGAPDVEITPEMIEAGLRVLYESCAVEHPLDYADRSTIRRIFLAMSELRGAKQ